MFDRSEDLRREAARCLESDERCANPNSRAELIRLAERFIDLAKSVPSDFGIVAQALSSMMADHGEPVVQQQQQIQPKRE